MDEIGFSVVGFLIVFLIMYVWGLVLLYRNAGKYKMFWKLTAPLLIIAPMLIIALNPIFAKRKDNAEVVESVVFFIFFSLCYLLLTLFFKFGMGAAFYIEIALFCSGLASLIYLGCRAVMRYRDNLDFRIKQKNHSGN